MPSVFCVAPGCSQGLALAWAPALLRMSLKNNTETQPSVPPFGARPTVGRALVVVKPQEPRVWVQALVDVDEPLLTLVAPPMRTARVGSTAMALPMVLGVAPLAVSLVAEEVWL